MALATSYGACTTETRTTETRREAGYPGYHVMVIKTDNFRTSRGVITGNHYGTSHDYEYRVELEPGSIEWRGFGNEPKQFVACEDQLYLRYLAIKSEYVKDASGAEVREPRVVVRHARHVDERYLFNLFGKQYWIEIDENPFVAGKCRELDVPNEEELSEGKPVF